MAGPLQILSEHAFGDSTARYLTDNKGSVGLWIYPTALAGQLAKRRVTVADESWVRDPAAARQAIFVEPLVHLKIVGDTQPDQFGPGRTLMWSPAIDRFRLVDQRCEPYAVVTTLRDDTGLQIQHRLVAGPQNKTLRCETSFTNGSDQAVRLELLTSFSLSGITPFAVDDAPGRLVVHRFRASWSMEGRLISDSVEHLHLERTWAGGGMKPAKRSGQVDPTPAKSSWSGGIKLSERFGQVGSMPVRGWFPTALLEDTEAGVVWGVRLACPTSWQLEVGRRNDDLVLSGGLADREFGHWIKTIQAGESFTAPPAWLTCVAGSVDDACDRLVSVDIPAVEVKPEIEQGLPILYNDWGTSWGEPRHEQLMAIADKVVPLGVSYLVIDAGWYMPLDGSANWSTTFGDWKADRSRFPNGLGATAAAIRERGLIPGLWMEPEHVAKDSVAFHQIDHLLKRDGETLGIGVRRAWNLHDPHATAFLDERVIRMLDEAGFGYLKIDYSETLGIGVDHPDSLGEGLRRHGEGTHSMLERIMMALPELVVEICSAGGSRMEASLLQRSSMSSFSDAHELVEIPIIAAALHRLVLPRQSQIWAVLHHDDSPQRLHYSLAATFLGRMCLTGDILELDEEQLAQIKAATTLYKQASPVIKSGISRVQGDCGSSWRHPKGWQAVVRTAGNRGFVVVHTFEKSPSAITIQLPSAGWRITHTLASLSVAIDGDQLSVVGCSDFASQVVLVELNSLVPKEGT